MLEGWIALIQPSLVETQKQSGEKQAVPRTLRD